MLKNLFLTVGTQFYILALYRLSFPEKENLSGASFKTKLKWGMMMKVWKLGMIAFVSLGILTACGEEELKESTFKDDISNGSDGSLELDGNHPDFVEWTYSGHTGPEYWSELSEKFADAEGDSQSPINVELEAVSEGSHAELEVHYSEGEFTLLNNGHTVEVHPKEDENYIILGGERYDFQQLHFHLPSEHQLNGENMDLELHFVNQDEEGNLAVLAYLMKEESANEILTTIWDQLPSEKDEERDVLGDFSLNKLLPASKNNVQYAGSLTTPPTVEGVSWVIFKEVGTVSSEQIKLFDDLIGHNARPVQELNDREISGNE